MWDERYSDNDYVYGTAPNEFLAANFPVLEPGARVLCLAEGEGRNAVHLARQGYAVTAVDASIVGLQKAEKLAKAHGVFVECIHADLARFELGDCRWDAIVSIFCHLPVHVREVLHGSIAPSLKPDGVFLLEAYRPEQLQWATGGPPVVELMMTAAMLERELCDMQFTLLQEIERPVLEGKFHTGTGAVVQVIAHKSA